MLQAHVSHSSEAGCQRRHQSWELNRYRLQTLSLQQSELSHTKESMGSEPRRNRVSFGPGMRQLLGVWRHSYGPQVTCAMLLQKRL